MESNQFIKEVYRRMALRTPEQDQYIDESYFFNSLESKTTISELKNILPANKESKILEIGYGQGFFISACVQMGYKNIYGLDFHNTRLSKIFPEIDYLVMFMPGIITAMN